MALLFVSARPQRDHRARSLASGNTNSRRPCLRCEFDDGQFAVSIYEYARLILNQTICCLQLLHAAALVVLAVILREPELLKRLQNEGAIVPMGEEPPAPLPTPLSNIDHPAHPYTNHRSHSLVYRQYICIVLLFLCVLLFIYTLCCIYFRRCRYGGFGHFLYFDD